MKELLKQLCTLDGVPGYEDEVRAFIEKEAAPYATSMEVDPVGNLIVFKKGAKARKRPLLLMAHMDEVGFLVKDITEDGMLKLAPAGGIDPRVLIGRRMRVGEKKIPHTVTACPSASGTNAWPIQMQGIGVTTLVVSLPLKYMHSPVEMLRLCDVKNVGKLVAAFLETFDGRL